MQNAWSVRIVMIVKLTWLNLSTKFVFLSLFLPMMGKDMAIELNCFKYYVLRKFFIEKGSNNKRDK
jgi:hypothetical protein